MNIILGTTLAVGIFFILAGLFLIFMSWNFRRNDQDIYALIAKEFGRLSLGASSLMFVICLVLA
jgi:hypothetical protein